MVKVVIADDEVRICQLIHALIDWEALGLEIAGIAHNGLEALELVRTQKPDILITDIRMPGCSGLELIGQVKQSAENLEIIIISGYAHFEYAQQAIKYGVGDYLLKPISKAELTATLEKLKERICERRRSLEGQEELRRKAEKDEDLLQSGLISDLMEQKKMNLSMQKLNENYYLKLRPGILQAFRIKMDCGREEFSPASGALLMEKAKKMIELVLKDLCMEQVVSIRGFSCAGFLNYEDGKQEEIRRAFKNCINHLELQKSLFRPVSFSASLGGPVRSAEQLGESMRDAKLLIHERIIRGTGRLYDRMEAPSGLLQSAVMERYLREMSHAAEVLAPKLLADALDTLSESVLAEKNICGYELLEAVYTAAEMFAVKVQMVERTEYMGQLRQQCGRCGEAKAVFEILREMQCSYLRQLSEKQESEAVRPIRKAKQYIQEHYSEPITQEEVSSEVGLSTAYFSSLFKKTEGEGFAKYLISVRMEQAKILLRESNLSVAEICRKVGYNDQKHFTHTFEKTAGVKPAVYRKLYG